MGLSEPLPRDNQHSRTTSQRALRRGSDRVQAASRILAALVVVVSVPFGVAQGSRTADSLRAEAVHEAATFDQRPVVLLEHAVPSPGRDDGLSRTWATWVSADGRQEAAVLVPDDGAEGETVLVWFDGEEPTRPPLTDDAATERAVVVGAFTVLGLAALALGGHLAVVALLDRYRRYRWATEWLAVERHWSGRC
jgi:hypothetical protein